MLNVESFKNSLKDYKFVDLFSGIGGFHQALSSFGAKGVYASDINVQANKVYEHNYGLKPNGDITLVDAKDIPKHDIITAGFPCQAFSIAGKKLGFEETRGTLFFDVARIIKHHQPKVAILENVKNFAKHDEGKTLTTILNTLEELGYDVSYNVLNSANFGVPQARERIYIVAVRKDLGKVFKMPSYAKDVNGNQLEYVKIKDIISASVDEVNSLKINDKLHKLQYKPSKMTGNPIRPVRVGEIDGRGNGQGYRLYSPEGVGNTLTANGGGLGSNKGGPYYFADQKIARVLSIRECLSLMGFPESFEPLSGMKESYRQAGNSVVVNVLQEIVKELIVQKVLN